jgi:hypothetical protein
MFGTFEELSIKEKSVVGVEAVDIDAEADDAVLIAG